MDYDFLIIKNIFLKLVSINKSIITNWIFIKFQQNDILRPELPRGVARYFFFRWRWRIILILLLQKYGKIYFLRAICQKKCLKLKIRAPLQGKNSFWYTWQFRSHIWISQGCFWLHLSVTNCSQSSSFPALLFKVILFWKFRGISLSFLLL